MCENDKYDNYDNITCFFQNKNLSVLIDPEDLHSGSSGMWVYKIVIKFMFATYEQKKELWFNLIKNHF